MKKLITFTFILITVFIFSQAPVQNISTDNNVVFRLFSTQNMYTLIKLNTRNGKMWQIQRDINNNQLETPLSLKSLVLNEDEINGRFFLYPTTHMYNFILIDQTDGRIWQVQWSNDDKGKMVIPITNKEKNDENNRFK